MLRKYGVRGQEEGRKEGKMGEVGERRKEGREGKPGTGNPSWLCPQCEKASLDGRIATVSLLTHSYFD